MYEFSDYASRGFNLVHNRLMPGSKRLSSLMLYATDRCDFGMQALSDLGQTADYGFAV